MGSTFTVTIPLGSAHLPSERIGASRPKTSTALAGTLYLEEALRWLPEQPPTLTELSGIETQSESRRRRILLADDNADMRQYVARLLSQRHLVTSVADGATALESARKEAPDLILSDIMMTGLDGFALLRAIRMDPELRAIPVILLSARAGEEARVEGLTAGADDYLVKPFSARELIARVETHLQMTAIRRESELMIRGLKDEVQAQADRERSRAIDNARLYEVAQKARREAETANRLKDEFLATVSHELRTPLNAILGWTRLLRTGRLDDAKKEQATEIVERNAVAQQQIVEDILDVSRIITGKLRLEVAHVELGPIVEAAVDSMRPSADAKGVELKSIVDSGANIVLGDPNRIQQIVWNLLSNAVKFTPRGGRVQVALQRVSSHAEITVSDTGKGISPDFLPHVFERFRQADSSSTRKYGGLGLGLAIVRHLTELNGGSVDAFSDGEDQGATFTVRLPMAIIHDKTPVRHSQPVFPHAAQENTSALHSLSLEGIKVLAVDDEPDARYLLEVVLLHYNANVKVVASTSDALKVIQDWQPNVIISDIGMPGEDGYALIRKLRGLPADRGGNVPAAALTAYARSEDRVRAIAAGYQTHLTKPVEPSELVAVVASLAGRAGRT